jgi:glutathione S-transferase
MFHFVALDILNLLDGNDRDYYRSSREQRVGMPLEAFVAERDERLPAFRSSLMPLRWVLQEQPYLGGEQPTYADYALFGGFQWARCVSAYELLAADDPIAAWRARLLQAFDGLALKTPAFS